jgi:hypothetical protein
MALLNEQDFHWVVCHEFEKRGWQVEENLLEHRTDGTDAFDTLFIGCEKFPQRNFYPISTNGVL